MNGISIYSYIQPNNTKNFGDDMSLPICRYASGKQTFKEDNIYADMYGIGSLLQLFKKRKHQVKSTVLRALKGKKPLVIWGTGAIDNNPIYLPRAKVLAIRGPHTAKALALKATVPFGDPGLLVSDILTMPSKIGKIGIVPHYVDKAHPIVAEAAKEDRFVIIDVEDDWENTATRIAQCDVILSSSLHGLIVADSYGIPNQWLEFSKNVIGAGFKFRDYADGIGRISMIPIQLSELKDIDTAIGMAETAGRSLGATQLISLKYDLKHVLRAHYSDE